MSDLNFILLMLASSAILLTIGKLAVGVWTYRKQRLIPRLIWVRDIVNARDYRSGNVYEYFELISYDLVTHEAYDITYSEILEYGDEIEYNHVQPERSQEYMRKRYAIYGEGKSPRKLLGLKLPVQGYTASAKFSDDVLQIPLERNRKPLTDKVVCIDELANITHRMSFIELAAGYVLWTQGKEY